MTTTAQPSFTPAGPWTVIENADGTTLLHNPQLAWNAVRTFEVSRNNITWLRDILNAQHALYAYAKAELMLASYYSGAPDRPAWRDVIDHLRSIGWDETQNINTFIYTYRATALAIAEGRS